MNVSRPVARELLQAVRLDPVALSKLLETLDADQSSAGAERRRQRRYAMRRRNCAITIRQPGSHDGQTFLVPTRNISTGGMSFLHGAFVHPGSHCTVHLIDLVGKVRTLDASVARCRYVSNGVHEVGIRFECMVDAADFCPDVCVTRVLLVDDDVACTSSAVALLHERECECEQVAAYDAALALLEQRCFDLLLVEPGSAVCGGDTLVQGLRAQGYWGLIAALATKPHPPGEPAPAGFDRCFGKPLSNADADVIVRWLAGGPLGCAAGSATRDADLPPAAFLQSLMRLAPRWTVASTGDAEALGELAAQLALDAKQHNYPALCDAADALGAAIRAKAGADKIRAAADATWALADRARRVGQPFGITS